MYIWNFYGYLYITNLYYILTGKCSGLEKRHVVIFWTFLVRNILNLNYVVLFLLRSNYLYCFLWKIIILWVHVYIENCNYDKIFVDLLSIGRHSSKMNYNTTYSYPRRQEQMVSYQICADDVQDIYWVSCWLYHINVFRSSN